MEVEVGYVQCACGREEREDKEDIPCLGPSVVNPRPL